MTTKKLITLFLFILLLPLPSLAQVAVDPKFDPNKIINDDEFFDTNSMSTQDIQNFLQSKNSYLANYITTNAYGTTKSAAEIIYDASNNNYDCYGVKTLSADPTEAETQQKCKKITTINPKLLLILLQKEESLIEDPSPSQTHLDWATGYGIFDGMLTCSPFDSCYKYKGFGKQVDNAAWQFWNYANRPDNYTYKAGQTYAIANTLDPYCTVFNQTMSVTPVNRATAALYNYTPHVFNGNYNVFRLWNRYFPKNTNVRIYPDGTLIQAKGQADIWLIEKSKRRPFANYSAFISRFTEDQIVTVDSSDLGNYSLGSSIQFANYSLVQVPNQTIYLLVDKTKRPFASSAAFKKIGFNPEEIETAKASDLDLYTVGQAITATSTNIFGVLMQDTKTGGIFYVVDGTKAPLTDKILLTTKFNGKKITKATTKTLDKYKKVGPVLLDDGTLVKTDSFPSVYLISNGKKRPFASYDVFLKLGYNAKNIITVSSKFLYNYAQGDAIQEVAVQQ